MRGSFFVKMLKIIIVLLLILLIGAASAQFTHKALDVYFNRGKVKVPDLIGSANALPDENEYGYPVHDILLGSDILIVENLCNLDRITQIKGIYSFLPLKLKASDGSPIRAVFMNTDWVNIAAPK